MGWGRLEDTLHDEPKFYRVANKLGISFVQVAGHMAVLWSWAHRHAPDGDLRDYDVPDIERAAKWEGDPGSFVSVLADDRVNLLDVTDRGYVLHQFMQRAEARKEAKKKQKQRMSRDKEKPVPGQSRDSPGNVPEERRGEEKRREEKRSNRGAPSEPTAVSRIRSAYLDGFRQKYGREGVWGKRSGGQAQHLLGEWPADTIVAYLEPRKVTDENGEEATIDGWFFAWKRPEVINAGHPFGKGAHSFVMRIHELDADVHNADRRKTAAIVSQQERRDARAVANDDAAEEAARRLEAKERSNGN